LNASLKRRDSFERFCLLSSEGQASEMELKRELLGPAVNVNGDLGGRPPAENRFRFLLPRWNTFGETGSILVGLLAWLSGDVAASIWDTFAALGCELV